MADIRTRGLLRLEDIRHAADIDDGEEHRHFARRQTIVPCKRFQLRGFYQAPPCKTDTAAIAARILLPPAALQR